MVVCFHVINFDEIVVCIKLCIITMAFFSWYMFFFMFFKDFFSFFTQLTF